MVNLGVESNFLSSTLVSALGLPLMHLLPFRFKVGNRSIEHELGGDNLGAGNLNCGGFLGHEVRSFLCGSKCRLGSKFRYI